MIDLTTAAVGKRRYPGLNYFSKEDHSVFCGRDEESDKLFIKVMLCDTLVLHAESGTGKSSLIQAGLLPRLEERELELRAAASTDDAQTGFLPVIIRLDAFKKNDKPYFLLEETIKSIKNCVDISAAPDLPYLEGAQESLWMIAKKIIGLKNQRLLLIFDQFEELQGYSRKQIRTFTKELAALLSNTIPPLLREKIKLQRQVLLNSSDTGSDAEAAHSRDMAFLEARLEAKAIFIVREDKLGTMSLLAGYFPDILKNDFTISALSIGDARKAITDPGVTDGNFVSPRLIMETPVVETILKQLSDPAEELSEGGKPGENIATKALEDSQLIDPIQLQIICSAIEQKKTLPGNSAGEVTVEVGDVPDMVNAVQDFYDEAWKYVRTELNSIFKSDEEFETIKNIIISELVVSDRRKLVLVADLAKNDYTEKVQRVLETLAKRGLLKKILVGLDEYFQLYHDRFIPPVNIDILKFNENINKIQALEKNRQKAAGRIRTILLIATILCVCLTVWAIVNLTDALQQKKVVSKAYTILKAQQKKVDSALIVANKERDSATAYRTSLAAKAGDLEHAVQNLNLQNHYISDSRDSLTSYTEKLKNDEAGYVSLINDLNVKLLEQEQQIHEYQLKILRHTDSDAHIRAGVIQSQIDSLHVKIAAQGGPAVKSFSSWFKEGFFLQFGEIKILLLEISKPNNSINVQICNTKSRGICQNMIKMNLTLRLKGTYAFSSGANNYVLRLDRIGSEGYNFLKPAADITLTSRAK